MMASPPGATGGMAEEIECYECKDMVDMRFVMADPEGHPLCSKCFNEKVNMFKKTDEELR